MPASKNTELPPLLRILQDQVIPLVKQRGTDNLVIARPTWKAMQAADQAFPEGVTLKRETLKSKRVRIRSKQLHGGEAAQVDAHWPEDHLYSRRAPILGFVINGIVAMPFGEYSLHCKAGHSFLVLPGTPHSDGSHLLLDDDFLHDGSREIFYAMVRGNGVECWLSRVRNHQRVYQKSPGKNFYIPHLLARQYLETFTEEMTQRRSHCKVMSNGLLVILMTLLLREIQEMRAFQSEESLKIPLDAMQTQEQNPISRAETYVQTHLHENLTIDTVARHLYMSRAYFTRLFRAHTGQTFVEYVTQCRLEEAKVLLHDTEWPVSRIGAVVGLKPSRFRAVFHDFIGVSPTVFRNQMRRESLFSENISENGAE